MSKVRGLSKEFINDLKRGGILSPLLLAVQGDSTLCLQIREEGINIYYRGGSIVRLLRVNTSVYSAKFDVRYSSDIASLKILGYFPKKIQSLGDTLIWVQAMPFLKHMMDLWFGQHPKEEREYQQLVVRENNFGKCGGKTDYIICDIEYAQANDRFDLIAVCWPSISYLRKKTNSVRISFIEMKYADTSLGGKAGLKKHIDGMSRFLSTPGKLQGIKDEMVTVFNQMQQLGLVKVKKSISAFSDEKPEFILLLANHDPDSKILERELTCLRDGVEQLPFDLKFAVSNFMGYALYQQNIYSLEQFRVRFKEQI